MALTVFVPAHDARLRAVVLAGSAIVGSPSGERVRIDFEGNRYGTAGMDSYAMRVLHAADRHLAHYPTVARALVAPDELVAVGEWDHMTQVLRLDDEAAVSDWLGAPLVPADRVAATRRTRERASIQAALRTRETRAQAAWFAARQGHADLVPPEYRGVFRTGN